MKNLKGKVGVALLSVAMAGTLFFGSAAALGAGNRDFGAVTAITASAYTANKDYSKNTVYTKSVDATDDVALYYQNVIRATAEWAKISESTKIAIYGKIYGNGIYNRSVLTGNKNEVGTFTVSGQKDYLFHTITMAKENGSTFAKEYYKAILQINVLYYKAIVNIDYEGENGYIATEKIGVKGEETPKGSALEDIRKNGFETMDALTIPANVLQATERMLENSVKTVYNEIVAEITVKTKASNFEGEFNKRKEDLSASALEELQKVYEEGSKAIVEADSDLRKVSAAYEKAVLEMDKIVAKDTIEKCNEVAKKNINVIFASFDEAEVIRTNAVKNLAEQYDMAKGNAAKATTKTETTTAYAQFVNYCAGNFALVAQGLDYTAIPEGKKYEDFSTEEKRVYIYKSTQLLYNDYMSANKSAFEKDGSLTGGFFAEWVNGALVEKDFTTDEYKGMTAKELQEVKSSYTLINAVRAVWTDAKASLATANESAFISVRDTLIGKIGGTKSDNSVVKGSIFEAYRKYMNKAIQGLYDDLEKSGLSVGKRQLLESTVEAYQKQLEGTEENPVKTIFALQSIYANAKTEIKGILPMWAWILIIVGGVLVLLVGVFFLVLGLTCKVYYCDPADGTVYASEFHFPGTVVNPYEVDFKSARDDEYDEETGGKGGPILETDDGTLVRVVGLYTNRKLTKKAKRFKMKFKKKRLYVLLEELY